MNSPNSPLSRPVGNRSIGAILVDAGRISAEDAARVVGIQAKSGKRFGDVALELKLISEDDIRYALSLQFNYPYLTEPDGKVSAEVVAAYVPFSPAVEGLRALRSQLTLRCFDTSNKNNCFAIMSPQRREGRSWLAANLAVVFSQLGERTLLIDADMRSPRQHALFGTESRAGLSAMLSGRAGVDVISRVPSLVDLSVVSAGAIPPNPQELIARPRFREFIEKSSAAFDVVIIDTPPAVEYADAYAVARQAGAALMLARKNVSRLRELRDVAENITQTGAQLVGSVLNE